MGFFVQPEYAAETRELAGEKPHTPDVLIVISGYRFYSPTMGRWLNRDPVGEDGKLTIYSVVVNNPVGMVDGLGLIGADSRACSSHRFRTSFTVNLPRVVQKYLGAGFGGEIQIDAERKVCKVCCGSDGSSYYVADRPHGEDIEMKVILSGAAKSIDVPLWNLPLIGTGAYVSNEFAVSGNLNASSKFCKKLDTGGGGDIWQYYVYR